MAPSVHVVVVGIVVVSPDKVKFCFTRGSKTYRRQWRKTEPGTGGSGSSCPWTVWFYNTRSERWGEVQPVKCRCSMFHVMYQSAITKSVECVLAHVSYILIIHNHTANYLWAFKNQVNIPECCMSQPVLLGIFRNHTTGGRPGLCFLIK